MLMLLLLPGWIIRVLVACGCHCHVGDSDSMWACHVGPRARQRRRCTGAAEGVFGSLDAPKIYVTSNV